MQTIDKIERGEIKFSRYLFPIAKRLGIVNMLPEGTAAAHPAGDNAGSREPLFGERDLPVYGSTQAGWDMVLTAEPIAYTLRPAPLMTVKEAFAVLVSTEAMSPVFELGDTLLINPHLPPEPGKDVLLSETLPTNRQSDTDRTVVVGRLEKVTDSAWILLQRNRGPKPVTFARERWPRCHRIVGKYSR